MARNQATKKRKEVSSPVSEEEPDFSDALDGVLSDSGEDDFAELEAELTDDEVDEEVADLTSDADEDSDSAASADNDELSYRIVKDATGGERYEYAEIDPVYDSDDSDAQGATNTIGNIPLSFYDSYPHIGYDINGKKIMRPATGDALDALLDSIEIPKGWTGLTDPETGKPLNLSQEELELLKKLQMNEIPGEGYDPYPVSCRVLFTYLVGCLTVDL